MNQPNKGFSIREMIEVNKKKKFSTTNVFDKVMPFLLFLSAFVSVVTTVGIAFTLGFELFKFFERVPVAEFLGTTEWYPLSADQRFGVWALVMGTLQITVIAMIVAVPLGLASAIYLSEYASERARTILKPILEVLAGVPTIVFGFFALSFVTPILQSLIPGLKIYNALSPGIVVGIMIIPMIASISEDAMSAVPKKIREGALGLGATRLEVAIKVVMPAALSGIIASIVLGMSRAIGETMIVTIAGGSQPNFEFNPLNAIQTMTAYIVQIAKGDAGYGTIEYYSIYAVGALLFIFTLVMNLFANWVTRRFREEY
ncbi:phosphate ABC transporter permease subunit PstC [Exiguobacterium sp. AM39-5BH]|uniref:phosphate ABC transporter permease subunit PstC n=1 Tax=Exiguobacterium sp. AM39-5BH TaxID=2292355 RepID=UPI000FE24E31|nr:phosphate ABC transporter permease subunit PstC [Exiguobacterium sp. AM39-5BH]RHB51837.1 phosphate ABC transporter permease subunit PstC [Exiguobacterium sp. AM39-5BH]